MNKMSHTLPFYRLAPALLLFSFFMVGCAGSPSEIRYDDRMKTYTSAQNENATAEYVLRPGNRPDFQPKAKPTNTQTSLTVVPKSQPASPPEAPKTQLADLQMVLETSDVLFAFDKAVIKSNVIPELDKWATYLNENPRVTADIYGYTDNTGPSTYNLDLSERRAQAVVNYLTSKGVSPKRLTAKGFGENQPVAPNTTREGRQKNRRVELKL